MIIKKEKIIFYLPLILLLVFIILNSNFYFEDVLIYARYIKNLLNGEGLVYNPGERFNGLTSPVFTYLSIVLSYITNKIILSINIVSGTSFILTIYLLQKIILKYANIVFVFFLSLLIITNQYFYIVFGMETHLFLFLIVLSIYLYSKEDYKWLILTGALLILTRSESIFLIIALIIFHFVDRRKFPKLSYFVIPILLLLAHYSFNYFYYGEFLPHTGMAKIYQGMSGLWGVDKPLIVFGGKIVYDMAYFDNVLYASIVIILSFIGFVGFLKNRLLQIVSAFLLLLFLFYAILNIPNYHWYYAPFILFSFVYAILGLAFLYSQFKQNRIMKYLLSITSIVIPVFLLSINLKNLNFNHPIHPYCEVSEWLRENTPDNSSVACVEIGVIGYFSDRHIIDILGLVNHHNAEFIGKRKFTKWFNYYKPDYIFAHDPLWIHENSIRNLYLRRLYSEVTSFKINDFTLLKRNEIESNTIIDTTKNIYNLIAETNHNSSYTNIHNYQNANVAFCHVGSEIIIDSSIANNYFTEHLAFEYGFKNDVLKDKIKTDGGVFEIFINTGNKDTLIYSSVINNRQLENNVGIIKDSININDKAEEYVFRVSKIQGKSDKWGLSFWRFFPNK